MAFALTKGDKPELVVQKLTELGVDRIVPFVVIKLGLGAVPCIPAVAAQTADKVLFALIVFLVSMTISTTLGRAALSAALATWATSRCWTKKASRQAAANRWMGLRMRCDHVGLASRAVVRSHTESPVNLAPIPGEVSEPGPCEECREATFWPAVKSGRGRGLQKCFATWRCPCEECEETFLKEGRLSSALAACRIPAHGR